MTKKEEIKEQKMIHLSSLHLLAGLKGNFTIINHDTAPKNNNVFFLHHSTMRLNCAAMIDLYIGETSRKGRGVFARSEIPLDAPVMEFRGPLVRGDQLHSIDLDHSLQLDTNLFQGPSGSLDDIINHSCNPNCGLRLEDDKLMCYAIRTISAGQELSWDYSTMQNSGWWEMDCKCGSSLCRRRIGDFRYLPVHIQRRYMQIGIVPAYIARDYRHLLPETMPVPELVPVRMRRSGGWRKEMLMA